MSILFFQMVRHGGCLGLGLAAMGSHRQDVYEQLKFNLYQDDAVTGEAAGIAMGMVMLGSKSTQAIEDMVAVSLTHILSLAPCFILHLKQNAYNQRKIWETENFQEILFLSGEIVEFY